MRPVFSDRMEYPIISCTQQVLAAVASQATLLYRPAAHPHNALTRRMLPPTAGPAHDHHSSDCRASFTALPFPRIARYRRHGDVHKHSIHFIAPRERLCLPRCNTAAVPAHGSHAAEARTLTGRGCGAVSRYRCKSELYAADLLLDVNSDIYPLEVAARYTMRLSLTLTTDVAMQKDEYDPVRPQLENHHVGGSLPSLPRSQDINPFPTPLGVAMCDGQ